MRLRAIFTLRAFPSRPDAALPLVHCFQIHLEGVTMSRLRVNCFSISFDGYSAGPDQTLENPLGVNAMQVFNWQFATQFHHQMTGQPGGETGMDNDLVNRGFENVGAWILGRNMFGPVRGPWPDDSWKGWWGDNPPYHVPVFVLTHHARAPITMDGGTTFHFITDGIHSALQ
jgi:dihydrofolate reductase